MAQDIQTLGSPERIVPTSAAGTGHARKDVSVRATGFIARKNRVDGEDRQRLIAEAAYFRAEQRGFTPGQELEDWLAAEIEIDALFDDEA